MRLLFVHQNFPAQFRRLAPALAARGDEVRALGFRDAAPLPGVTLAVARPSHASAAKHPWAATAESAVIRAEAALRAALALRRDGFSPDVIVAHPAWGDAMLLKEVWPDARLGLYCEYFLPAPGTPVFDADSEFAGDPAEIRGRQKVNSLPQYLAMAAANAGISPTRYQADTYPCGFRRNISVIHDGIDLDALGPRPAAALRFGNGKVLTAADEVVTYIARHLEPARGFHVFMRALPELMRARPAAHFVIVGGDGVSYGRPPPAGTWREALLREVGDRLDPARLHIVGQVAYPLFLDLLAVARLRIYPTVPMVLSWSVLEAMAMGLPVLASDVAPVREVIADGVTGRLFPFHDREALVAAACDLLDDEPQRRMLAANARALVERDYALRTVCLPAQFAWLDALSRMTPLPPAMED